MIINAKLRKHLTAAAGALLFAAVHAGLMSLEQHIMETPHARLQTPHHAALASAD